MPNQTIANVVIIGVGHMGRIRSNAIRNNPRFCLCGVCDADFNAAKELARRYKVREDRRRMNKYYYINAVQVFNSHKCQSTGNARQRHFKALIKSFINFIYRAPKKLMFHK